MKISPYKNLLSRVINIIESARRKTVRQTNIIITQTYWGIGRVIVEEEQKGEQRAKYGEKLLLVLSDDLTKRYGRGFSVDNLEAMRKLYILYPYILKSETMSRESIKSAIMSRISSKLLIEQLSWSHFRELIKINDPLARQFYEIETIKNNWSTRELDRQINSMLFERISLSKDKKGVLKLAKKGQIIEKPEDAIRDPYVLEFLGLPEKHQYSESKLEQALIDHLQEFLLELGKGFAFVARQKRITIDNEHYYIDLIFYHRILRCLVLIDLKVGKLDHKDVGQMNFYLNYIKDKEIFKNENPPVGIILCTESLHSKVFVEYALGGLSNKVFISKYKLYLPTKKELEQEIKKETSYLKLASSKNINENQK